MPPKHKKVVLTKAEKALKKLEAKRQLRRDLLGREVQHGQLSLKVLEKKWRQMLLKMRLPEFHQDAKTMWHKFERAVDFKSYVLSCVLDEIDEANLQYNVNLQSHVETVDKLIVFFGERLDELRVAYQEGVYEIQDLAAVNANKISLIKDADEEHLKFMLFTMEQHLAQSDTSRKVVHLATTDEETSKYSDVRQILRSTLERQFEVTWVQYREVLTNYHALTDDRRKEYAEYKSRDDQALHLIDMQATKTEQLYAGIRKLRVRVVSERGKQQEALSDYKYESQFFADTYVAMRGNMADERIHDHDQLTLLTVESNKSIKCMENVVAKGERILNLASLCRKLETQNEKVTPFIRSSVDEGDSDSISPEFSDSLLHKWDELNDMRHFWLRVGEAGSKRGQIKECIASLRAEKQTLCRTLQEYMAGVAGGGRNRDRSPPYGLPNCVTDASTSIKHMLP